MTRGKDFVLILIILSFVGCAREPDLAFTSRSEVTELPDLHREFIESNLARIYGTPNDPRLRMPASLVESEVAEDEADEEEMDAETSEDAEDTAPPLPKLVDTMDLNHLKRGAIVYLNRCAGCHGVTGDGEGEAAPYLSPKPRDYRSGVFKFTSTPYGVKPTRADLIRTIRRGAKGTSMPAFPWMSEQDLDAVVDYVILLSKRGEVEKYVASMSEEYDEDAEMEFLEFEDAIALVDERWTDAEYQAIRPTSAEPAPDEDSVLAGRKLFLSRGCSKCHGEDAQGQTEWLSHEFLQEQEALPPDQQEKINYDAWGQPAPAADITARLLHGGRRPIDLYRRIHTGINGTPMPAFGGTFAESPDDLWHLVHYVLHIVEGGDPTLGISAADVDPTETDASESQEAS